MQHFMDMSELQNVHQMAKVEFLLNTGQKGIRIGMEGIDHLSKVDVPRI